MGIVKQSALMVVVALVGCGGSAFEQGSPAGSDLAGAAGAADAGSIGTGGSSMPAGAEGGMPNGDAGQGGAEDVAGGSSGSSGSSAGGSSGSSAGGSSGSSAGGSSGSSAGGPAACLPGWQASPCDTCTGSSAVPGSKTCGELLACYVAKGGTANCDYVGATADAVVKVAHDVLTCRCH